MKKRSKYTDKFPIGHRFGKWTVVDGIIEESPAKLRVKCDCGTEKLMDVYDMVSKRSQSCGCVRKQRTGSNNPNWKGQSGISATVLYNNSRSTGLSYGELVQSYNQSTVSGNYSTTSCVAVPIDKDQPISVDNIAWVSSDIAPAARAVGVRNLILGSQTISQTTPNIFDRLGFKSTNGE